MVDPAPPPGAAARRPRPLRFVAALCLVVAGACAAGCGDEPPPRHGLGIPSLPNEPVGGAVTAAFEVEDGAAYRGRIRMTMEVVQVSIEGGRPKEVRRSGSAVIEMVWTFHHPDGRPPFSGVTLRYLEAEGEAAEAYLRREMIHGTLAHDPGGRVQPESLTLQGGVRDEQLQAHDLIGQLLLAGFGGSPPWTPPRPIRQGEAWALENFIQPRAIANVERYARDVGLQTPRPTFQGKGRLVAILPGEAQGEGWLDLALEALIEIDGPMSHGQSRGHLSVGDRTEGRASVSAKTGVPRTFDVTHTRRTQVKGEGEVVNALITSRIHGEIERMPK